MQSRAGYLAVAILCAAAVLGVVGGIVLYTVLESMGVLL